MVAYVFQTCLPREGLNLVGHGTFEAKLQVAVAFLPGRICESHVSLLAKKLLKTISDVTAAAGVVSRPVAFLTEQLGEPLHSVQTIPHCLVTV